MTKASLFSLSWGRGREREGGGGVDASKGYKCMSVHPLGFVYFNENSGHILDIFKNHQIHTKPVNMLLHTLF